MRDVLACAVPGFGKTLAETADADAAREIVAGAAEHARRASQELFASRGEYREAILWQNQVAARTAIAPFAEGRGAAKRQRQRADLAMKYLQRYTTKNETIGFFGPLRWVDVGVTPTSLSEPGASLVDRREVLFEAWAIEALARDLDRKHALWRWAPPSTNPFVEVGPSWVRFPFSPPMPVEPVEAAVAARCDGRTTPRGIAEALGRPLAEVEAALSELASRGIASRHFRVPHHPFPEIAMKERAACIEDDAVRGAVLAQLDEIERLRARVREAAGDPDRLDTALGALRDHFLEHGEVAKEARLNGREPVYEDCRRDVHFALGRDLLDKLAGPLDLVLRSARWFVGRCVAGYQRELDDLMGSDVERPFVEYWIGMLQRGLVGQEPPPLPVSEAVAELRRRWAGVLPPPGPQPRLDLRSADLVDAVHAAFPISDASPPRYYAPDVLVCAAGPEAFARGEVRLVLGELHLTNTLTALTPMMLFAETEAIEQRLRSEGAIGPVRMLPPKGAPSRNTGWVHRCQPHCFPATPDTNTPVRAQTLRPAELRVVRTDGGLVVRSGDGTEWPLLEFLRDAITTSWARAFQWIPDGEHRPRITIDDLVVARERWLRPLAELAADCSGDQTERVHALSRRFHGVLPRFVFCVIPGELKPLFVDLDDALLVDLLARRLRSAAEKPQHQADAVVFTEMLPSPDELWLSDADGATYTSELRLAFLG